MSYSVKYKKSAQKKLEKFDACVRNRIKAWIEENLSGCENLRAKGHALEGDLSGLWRYRVGDYRIIAQIRDEEVVILVVKIAKRGEVYHRPFLLEPARKNIKAFVLKRR